MNNILNGKQQFTLYAVYGPDSVIYKNNRWEYYSSGNEFLCALSNSDITTLIMLDYVRIVMADSTGERWLQPKLPFLDIVPIIDKMRCDKIYDRLLNKRLGARGLSRNSRRAEGASFYASAYREIKEKWVWR